MSQTLARAASPDAPPARRTDRLPEDDGQYDRVRYYIEDTPVPDYHNAPPAALERFRDLKYGIRIVWGVYSLLGLEASWPEPILAGVRSPRVSRPEEHVHMDTALC